VKFTTYVSVINLQCIAEEKSAYTCILKTVIPAEAGTHNPLAVQQWHRGRAAILLMLVCFAVQRRDLLGNLNVLWVPAFAGMTVLNVANQSKICLTAQC